MQGKRVVVTGGAGVIGRELLTLLIERGAKALSLDREALPEDLAMKVEHWRIDLAEENLDAIKDFDPEIIFHLAATFERTEETPDFLAANYHDNVLATHRIQDLMPRLSQLTTYVFASSYLVYQPNLYLLGNPGDEVRPLREDDSISPRNLCGVAKYVGERETAFLQEVCGLRARTVWARIYRVYGRGSRDVISRWVRALVCGQPIIVYNEANRFDFIFAADVAEGLLRLADSPKARGAINLGTGTGRSITDVLEVLCNKLRVTDDLIRHEPSKPPYESSWADLSRLRSVTGWAPPTDLVSGIAQIISYETDRLERGDA